MPDEKNKHLEKWRKYHKRINVRSGWQTIKCTPRKSYFVSMPLPFLHRTALRLYRKISLLFCSPRATPCRGWNVSNRTFDIDEKRESGSTFLSPCDAVNKSWNLRNGYNADSCPHSHTALHLKTQTAKKIECRKPKGKNYKSKKNWMINDCFQRFSFFFWFAWVFVSQQRRGGV